jgi:hypothetical protein
MDLLSWIGAAVATTAAARWIVSEVLAIVTMVERAGGREHAPHRARDEER